MPQSKTLMVKMRIRVYAGGRMLGPGKMELVAHIDATGSLAAAAKKMRMSYMRAWTLVQNLNSDPNRPMIEMSRGARSARRDEQSVWLTIVHRRRVVTVVMHS
jgi:molybdenum-dependent DNA-binding transcriptional regulator ModE